MRPPRKGDYLVAQPKALELLGITEQTFARFVRDGFIHPTIKIAGRSYFATRDLDCIRALKIVEGKDWLAFIAFWDL